MSNILGVDPGPRHTGMAVHNRSGFLLADVWELDEDWSRACSQFRARLEEAMERYNTELIAVEDTLIEGRYFTPNVRVLGLGSIVRSLCDKVLVQAYQPLEWMKAITGETPRNFGFAWTSPMWKRTVRDAVLLRLKEMGVDGKQLLGEDPGNHRADAMGIALYASDKARMQQHMTACPSRGRAG